MDWQSERWVWTGTVTVHAMNYRFSPISERMLAIELGMTQVMETGYEQEAMSQMRGQGFCSHVTIQGHNESRNPRP